MNRQYAVYIDRLSVWIKKYPLPALRLCENNFPLSLIP